MRRLPLGRVGPEGLMRSRRGVARGWSVAAVGVLLVAAATGLPPATGLSEEGGTVQPIPGGTLSKIAAGGPVRVCADPDNLPFSSRDSQQQGFDVEVARAVANEI